MSQQGIKASFKSYKDVQEALNTFVSNAGVSPDDAPHGAFWNTLSYIEFTTGNLPGDMPDGNTYKILVKGKPEESTIIKVLNGRLNRYIPQMPQPSPPYGGQSELIAALSQWIKDGCPNQQSLAETEAPLQVTKALLQQTYSWKATGGDNPQAIRIDSRLFNRHEGYEVIPMIQKVVNHFGYVSPADVQKVEALIGSELPGNVRGRKKVFDWLVGRLA